VHSEPYTKVFYKQLKDGARRSAEVIVPLVLQLIPVRSVLDVGCGDGSWLSVFQEFGVKDILGIDGDYVTRDILQIPANHFLAVDLTKPFNIGRVFDLAISLEVAEHLPAHCASGLVASLTQQAPVILFSAAIPMQGGAHHINEQWPDHWAELFREHNYLPVDCIRKRVWQDDLVECWYAQNTLLFVQSRFLESNAALQAEFERTNLNQLCLVHPKQYRALETVVRAQQARLPSPVIEDDSLEDCTDMITRTFKTSVVIPCFNHGEFLPEAVHSVIGIKRNDVELIVVDDGSTEERTRTELNSLAGLGIKVIRQENKGLAAARNVGIRASKGEYILPLDADNRLRPSYITRGVEILDANPEIGVVYGDAEYIGLRNGRWDVGSFDPNRLLHWNYIDACAIYRRSVWEQNGGYDGTMPVQGLEDWDFWLGAVEHGWKFAYVPEILFDYRKSEGSMITCSRGFERSVSDFVARKHSPLYRDAFLEVDRKLRQEESIRWNLHNLRRLFRSRLIRKLQEMNLL
jgi:glycosyltransferase involved in cell wall biosynthesis